MSQDSLIEKYIELNPHKGGLADARLIKYGTAVWALVGHYRVVDHDITRVATDYEVPVEAVEAALAFYRKHREIIDDRINANIIPMT